jgi:ATP-binding cassette subfamily B protein
VAAATVTVERVAGARAALQEQPVLQLLPPEHRQRVVDGFVPVSFPFGAAIVEEGAEADALYVLAAGRARVLRRGDGGDEIPLGTLRPGDSFGEVALLERGRRTATVRASSEVTALRLDRSTFDALVEQHPEVRQHFELQVRRRSLHNLVREHAPFGRLPAEALRILVEGLEPAAVEAGALVVREGDPPGPVYVVADGRLRAFTEAAGRRRYLRYLRKGDAFGELALLRETAHPASVEAASRATLLRIPAETFRRLLDRSPELRRTLEQRAARGDAGRAGRVPLDFTEELLPAEVRAHRKFGPARVDGVAPGTEGAAEAAPLDPFAAPDGRFVKRRRRIRRFPHVHQVDEMDCGPAALAMVCRYFGRAVSVARIRQLAHTATDGTSLRGLTRAAEELGLAARSVKASRRNLGEMPLPAIVHWEGNHWVVLYDVDPDHVRVADPALGLRRLPRAAFEAKWSGYAALFDYTEAFATAPEGRAAAAWLWRFVRPYSDLLAKALALAFLVSALQMALPVFTQVVVDRVLVEQDVAFLRVLILAMVAALGLMVAALAVQRFLLSWVAVRVDAASLDFLTRRLLSLPVSYFATRRTGDIQRRLAGTRQLREFVVQQGVSALSAAAQLLVALVLMGIYSPLLTGVYVVTAPAYALLMRLSARWLRPIFDNLEEAFGKYFSHQIDAIRGIATVKALGAEATFRRLMLDQFHGVARRLFRADLTMMCNDGAVRAVSFLSLVLFLWMGAHQVMAGRLTIGGLVALSSLVALANAPVHALLSLWDDVQLAAVLLDRLSDVFEQEPEQGADHSHLLPVRSLEGRIQLRGVTFRYGGVDAPAILDGVSVDVPPGTRVAIVGRSGSGKTTLVRCLSGLLEPTAGTILYDGVDLRRLSYRDLRRQIGFVPQETHLFDDTIARNIALGDEEPDLERVLWAARVANAHGFIERLPLGYETRVGETGVALAGGQCQRIAIARAVYARPPVLVFDEATSSLDTESERAIQENLAELLAGRTAFVIAHRLSTIRDADLILVLEQGKLVEQGTHEALMERRGLYHHLVSEQLAL